MYLFTLLFRSDVSNVASNSIDENLLVDFLEEDGIDVSTAKFLHVSYGSSYFL